MTPLSANSLLTSPMRRMFSSRSWAAADQEHGGKGGPGAGDWHEGANEGRAASHGRGPGSSRLRQARPETERIKWTGAAPRQKDPSLPSAHSEGGARASHAHAHAPVKPRFLLRPCRTLSPSSSTVMRPRCARACSSVHATVDLPLPLRPACGDGRRQASTRWGGKAAGRPHTSALPTCPNDMCSHCRRGCRGICGGGTFF